MRGSTRVSSGERTRLAIDRRNELAFELARNYPLAQAPSSLKLRRRQDGAAGANRHQNSGEHRLPACWFWPLAKTIFYLTNEETAQFGAHGLGAVFGITPIFCAKAMKRGSSL